MTDLIRRAQAGDREALTTLWRSIDRLLVKMAGERKPITWDFEDAVQQARLWFLIDLPLYDADRGRFIPWLRLRIKYHFRDAVRDLCWHAPTYPMSDVDEIAEIPGPDRFSPALTRAFLAEIQRVVRPAPGARAAIAAIQAGITLQDAALAAGKGRSAYQSSFTFWRRQVIACFSADSN